MPGSMQPAVKSEANDTERHSPTMSGATNPAGKVSSNGTSVAKNRADGRNVRAKVTCFTVHVIV